MDNILLINPYELKPHERVNPTRILSLFVQIIISGKFTQPLLIDKETKTILDGHHRCWIAKKLGLKKVPCYCLNYLEEKSIQVSSRRLNISINKNRILDMAHSGNLFPNKTTKHEYKSIFVNFKLSQLMN